ncbi:energy transducer TonB [Paracrocinitomix mangrovi]|uniref:energy transducer TonB n=1 Tax=Paracrocinitomix mangrovi TaxID=2862509 RepID=UPI001C8E38A2|nr:energy transducer TonB [Paracrocinitomix mangrovi]UKN00415.1 energy transducer TonB [Paracrocinitomix mangrovi]
MIAKKSKKANLERKRFAFFQIGLLLSGAMCLVAFEYTSGVSEERVVVFDEGPSITYIDPIDEDLYNQKEQPKQEQQKAQAVNLENVVEGSRNPNEGAVVVTDPDITFDPNDLTGIGPIDPGQLIEPTGGIVDVPDFEPEFIGGLEAMSKWLQKEIDYPQDMIDMGLSDLVYVQFVVNEDGSISNVEVVKSQYEAFAKEGKRVVKKMPKWKPGEQAGKPVRVRFTLPINFQLPK